MTVDDLTGISLRTVFSHSCCDPNSRLSPSGIPGYVESRMLLDLATVLRDVVQYPTRICTVSDPCRLFIMTSGKM